jgi:3-hydroxymyristoyl/3-hydroxydecanoyl-(acyl carrier protein) dehydratase
MSPAADNTRELAETFVVPHEHPSLAGHFPGDPIVPGVLLLEMCCDVLQRALPELGPLTQVSSTKFTRIVRPGETVTVRYGTSATAASIRFSCETHDGTAAQGQLVFRTRA